MVSDCIFSLSFMDAEERKKLYLEWDNEYGKNTFYTFTTKGTGYKNNELTRYKVALIPSYSEKQ